MQRRGGQRGIRQMVFGRTAQASLGPQGNGPGLDRLKEEDALQQLEELSGCALRRRRERPRHVLAQRRLGNLARGGTGQRGDELLDDYRFGAQAREPVEIGGRDVLDIALHAAGGDVRWGAQQAGEAGMQNAVDDLLKWSRGHRGVRYGAVEQRSQ